ncbi:Tn3 family transposase, partial [Acinetobacter indicus]|uniref:Tn3 family transposase n=1 Tax=Acinetobacter indicus TaxID=756892 RepID=UPI001BB46975
MRSRISLIGVVQIYGSISAYDRALAMVVEAQAALPMARFWGMGTSASSDGQFFVATEQGE